MCLEREEDRASQSKSLNNFGVILEKVSDLLTIHFKTVFIYLYEMYHII